MKEHMKTSLVQLKPGESQNIYVCWELLSRLAPFSAQVQVRKQPVWVYYRVTGTGVPDFLGEDRAKGKTVYMKGNL